MNILNYVSYFVVFGKFIIFQGCHDALKEKLLKYSSYILVAVIITIILEVLLFSYYINLNSQLMKLVFCDALLGNVLLLAELLLH